jgi:hypothetical protein
MRWSCGVFMKSVFKWVFLLMIVGLLSLFVIQNIDRTPTLDSTGAYLSLDLYFVGLDQREPISFVWYLLGSFLLGMCTTKLFSLRQR